LLVALRVVYCILYALLFGVLVAVHLVVGLHVAEKHQLDRIEFQLLRLPEPQEATEFVESTVDLVVEVNQVGSQNCENVVQADIESHMCLLVKQLDYDSSV
jgi:hypothetical protein